MIVCHCKALTDRDLCEALCQGARTAADLERQCGAGAECGGCRPLVRHIAAAMEAERHERFQGQHAAPAVP